MTNHASQMRESPPSRSDNNNNNNASEGLAPMLSQDCHFTPFPACFAPVNFLNVFNTFSPSRDPTVAAPSYRNLLEYMLQSHRFNPLALFTDLDDNGFTVWHYIASTVLDPDEILGILDLAQQWNVFPEWDPGSMLPFPGMMLTARPVVSVGVLFSHELEQQKHLLSMTGYTPLGVATRCGNVSAIQVFVTQLHASPFELDMSDCAVENHNSRTVETRSMNPLQIAIDHSLAEAFVTLLECAALFLKSVPANKEHVLHSLTRLNWPHAVYADDTATDTKRVHWNVQNKARMSLLHLLCASRLDDELALALIKHVLRMEMSTVIARDNKGFTILTTSLIHARGPDFIAALLELPEWDQPAPLSLVRFMWKLNPSKAIMLGATLREVILSIADTKLGLSAVDWAEKIRGPDSEVVAVLRRALAESKVEDRVERRVDA
ncbi:hypothetical protein BJ741DRAFT_618209 [Chytriomyces cf. hyalinus JEL632]|nr:hypothetical protein BJ741DRAFT_618209 [Chytriomyces cf. hyalinus JEL632]